MTVYISSWDEWKWLIDKVITGLVIVGAALAAQSILHKNTIRREAKDLNLRKIEEMVIIYEELRTDTMVCDSRSAVRADAEIISIMAKFCKIRAIDGLHFGLVTNIGDLINAYVKIAQEIQRNPKSYILVQDAVTKLGYAGFVDEKISDSIKILDNLHVKEMSR